MVAVAICVFLVLPHLLATPVSAHLAPNTPIPLIALVSLEYHCLKEQLTHLS